MNKVEYEREQAIQLCGRVDRRTEVLRERHWNLLGRGKEDRAKERYERLLELMETRRDNPESIPSDSSRNPVLERMSN